MSSSPGLPKRVTVGLTALVAIAVTVAGGLGLWRAGPTHIPEEAAFYGVLWILTVGPTSALLVAIAFGRHSAKRIGFVGLSLLFVLLAASYFLFYSYPVFLELSFFNSRSTFLLTVVQIVLVALALFCARLAFNLRMGRPPED